MSAIKADFLMFIVTIFWGSSYLFMKLGLGTLGEFNLIALRFGLAFILAGAIFYRNLLKTSWKTIKYAFLLGLILFIIFTTLTFGLNTTTTSNAGFLVSLTVVFVPLMSIFISKTRLELRLLLSVIIALTGIAFLTIQLPFHMTVGDLLSIAAAVFYAMHIIVVSIAAKEVDTLNLGILQLGFAALFGLIFSFIFETPQFPDTSTGWIAILSLSIFCSGLGFILQTVAQKYSTPTRTGLIFSLEPVFAALFGYLFINEILTFKGYLGAALVLVSIAISTVKMNPKPKTLHKEQSLLDTESNQIC